MVRLTRLTLLKQGQSVTLITSDIIRKYIQKVWDEKVIPIMQQKSNQGYILIQFQLEKTSGGFISIDKMWGTTGTQEEKILFINNIIAVTNPALAG